MKPVNGGGDRTETPQSSRQAGLPRRFAGFCGLQDFPLEPLQAAKVALTGEYARSRGRLGASVTEARQQARAWRRSTADFVTASLRVMPRRALDKGYTFHFPELEPALRDLLGK